jgi:trehalose 6-phosphate synthase
MNTNRLLVISNRLPVSVERTPEGLKVHASSGGLVTALDSVLRKNSGVWIGWSGVDADQETSRMLELASLDQPYRLEAVTLTRQEVEKFYLGFANEIIWPLFHDLQSRCNFDPEYWAAYREVNRRFAAAAAKFAANGDFVWVHDYHFTLVGKFLREQRPHCGIGFFQHIPFPPADIFAKLPWRIAILEGMLHHDVVGFQTERDRRNFIDCVRALLPHAHIVHEQGETHVHCAGRCSRIGVFPISIDFHEFAEVAAAPEVNSRVAEIRHEQNGRQIVLGVDRLDYTKGIIERLLGYRHLLRQAPEIRKRITLVQVVVPSRADIPKYQELKREVERMVSEINGEFSDTGWVPIHYLYRHLTRKELIAHYRAADVAFVTPLKDGMNLVAKEYCGAQVEHQGVLILSEFAGSAAELACGAIMVNPNDQHELANALLKACGMSPAERRNRMIRIRAVLRKNDVYGWSESFLRAGAEMQGNQCQPPRRDLGMALGAN